MTAVYKVDGVALPDSAIIMGGITGLPSAAWYCEPGVGDIGIDDPGGAYDLAGWHTFTADETACTGRERVWSGWLVGRTVNRGPYRHGAARVWTVQIIDINALFGFEVFRASTAQRPAETDVARVTWCLASGPMTGTPAHDNGRLATAGPVNLAAAEFVRSFPVDMLTNAAGVAGKNVFAYWDHAAAEIGLSYEFSDDWPASTLSISNVLADVDGSTVFYPLLDAQLDADAYPVFTGALLDYVGGATYGRNDDLVDELSPTEFSPATFLRDEMIQSDRIGKLSTADAFLATYLDAAAQEKEEISVTIRLPAALVNYVEAGMRIDARLVHLPGLEDFTTLPIIRRSAVPSPGRRDSWDVRIQLSRNVRPALSLNGPGGPPATAEAEPDFEGADVITTENYHQQDPGGRQVIRTRDGASTTYGIVSGGSVITVLIEDDYGTGSAAEDIEWRHFVQHEAPPAATHARLTTRVLGTHQHDSPPSPTSLMFAISRASWNPASTPVWDSIREVLTSGSVRPGRFSTSNAYENPPADSEIVEVSCIVPVVNGYAQMAFGFGPQDSINGRTNPTVDTLAVLARFSTGGWGTISPNSEDRLWFSHPDGENTGLAGNEAYRLEFISVAGGSTREVFDGDGTTTQWTLAGPYGAGGVTCTVNGVDCTGDLVEVDPGAGTIGLTHAPVANSDVVFTRIVP